MADDAFALSPITARASPPTDADYEAICGAFMETARGRWFLTEYARRNRNADTRLVLDMLVRLEATVASQQQDHGRPLAELLPAVNDFIAEARDKVLAALPQADVKPAIESIQRAATLLREITWTLRESDAENGVCDLLDAQADAIVAGCARVHSERAASLDVPATVTAAFHSLSREINSLAKAVASAEPGKPSANTTPAPAAPPPDADAAPAETAARDTFYEIVETAEKPAAAQRQPDGAQRVAKAAAAPVEPSAPAVPDEPPAPVAPEARANLWEDLEIIDTGPAEESDKSAATAATTAAPKQPAQPPPSRLNGSSSDAHEAAPVHRPAAPATSLGYAVLESGLVAGKSSRHTDTLAPFRRMSQAEKIAFFS